jgi:hypothetical protein
MEGSLVGKLCLRLRQDFESPGPHTSHGHSTTATPEQRRVAIITTTHDKMSSRPVVTVHGADGAAGKDSLTLPNVFKAPIRPDIVQCVETSKSKI